MFRNNKILKCFFISYSQLLSVHGYPALEKKLTDAQIESLNRLAADLEECATQ